jgi:endonuclease III
MAKKEQLAARARAINDILARVYPGAKCSLNFKSPFHLLVATILSAQCTDERVNMVTPGLFKKYPNPKALAAAEQEELEQDIKSTGFFRNKSKSLRGMAQGVVEKFGGKVPSTMEELRELPGVGRKTANVVLGNCFDTPGITVDTHVQRVTRRLGLTGNEDPEKIEQDLNAVVPQPEWTHFSHRIILHGRAICQARRPLCEECPVAAYCDYFAKFRSPEQRRAAAAAGRTGRTSIKRGVKRK